MSLAQSSVGPQGNALLPVTLHDWLQALFCHQSPIALRNTSMHTDSYIDSTTGWCTSLQTCCHSNSALASSFFLAVSWKQTYIRYAGKPCGNLLQFQVNLGASCIYVAILLAGRQPFSDSQSAMYSMFSLLFSVFSWHLCTCMPLSRLEL